MMGSRPRWTRHLSCADGPPNCEAPCNSTPRLLRLLPPSAAPSTLPRCVPQRGRPIAPAALPLPPWMRMYHTTQRRRMCPLPARRAPLLAPRSSSKTRYRGAEGGSYDGAVVLRCRSRQHPGRAAQRTRCSALRLHRAAAANRACLFRLHRSRLCEGKVHRSRLVIAIHPLPPASRRSSISLVALAPSPALDRRQHRPIARWRSPTRLRRSCPRHQVRQPGHWRSAACQPALSDFARCHEDWISRVNRRYALAQLLQRPRRDRARTTRWQGQEAIRQRQRWQVYRNLSSRRDDSA